MDQFDLAETLPTFSSDEWGEFLSDGSVAKYIEKQTNLFKAAQMRKLVAKSTENDKSVGTAQMLNAIGKTLDDDDAETHTFIYTHVPLNAMEKHAATVAVDTDWDVPDVITQEQEDTVVKSLVKPVEIEEPEEDVPVTAELNDEDLF